MFGCTSKDSCAQGAVGIVIVGCTSKGSCAQGAAGIVKISR